MDGCNPWMSLTTQLVTIWSIVWRNSRYRLCCDIAFPLGCLAWFDCTIDFFLWSSSRRFSWTGVCIYRRILSNVSSTFYMLLAEFVGRAGVCKSWDLRFQCCRRILKHCPPVRGQHKNWTAPVLVQLKHLLLTLLHLRVKIPLACSTFAFIFNSMPWLLIPALCSSAYSRIFLRYIYSASLSFSAFESVSDSPQSFSSSNCSWWTSANSRIILLNKFFSEMVASGEGFSKETVHIVYSGKFEVFIPIR